MVKDTNRLSLRVGNERGNAVSMTVGQDGKVNANVDFAVAVDLGILDLIHVSGTDLAITAGGVAFEHTPEPGKTRY